MPWEIPSALAEVLAVHAAFLNFDKIILFGGDQYDPKLAAQGQFAATRLFDCGLETVTKESSPVFDAFCSGHSLTTHGTLVVAGGTSTLFSLSSGHHDEHFPGLRDMGIYRYETSGSGWRTTADLTLQGKPLPICRPGQDPDVDSCVEPADHGKIGGRWYPTLVTLANGDILALAGHPQIGDDVHCNYIPEVFTPVPAPTGEWHPLGSYTNEADDQLFSSHQPSNLGYPRAHLLPTGDVFFSSPTIGERTVTLSVGRNPWSGRFSTVCKFGPPFGTTGEYRGLDQTSVLLPLLAEEGYRPRVLISGGTDAWVIDLGDWKPGTTREDTLSWVPTAPRALSGSPDRLCGNVVLLPTGELLAVGGVSVPYDDKSAIRWPEVFNPFTNTWSALTKRAERETVPRNYHSVALLMADGRVWTAGSSKNHGPGVKSAEQRIEIYEPWYQHRKGRPEITAAPDRWRTGEDFVMRTTQASDIVRVAMVRCGSCTHAFNSDQRFISPKFEYKGGDRLIVTAPPNGNISPPGVYFLYTINNRGLPSEGVTLYMSGDPETSDEKAWEDLYKGQP
jgi:hypothetical protein